MSKKWTFMLLSAILLTLICFACIMLILDPVLNYGTERNITPYYHYATLYTNPGIARHYTYDTVMVGTSMIQNTDVDLCDALFNCKMVRLPYSGGTSYDMKIILDLCFSSSNQIKTVYWEMDQFQLFSSADAHRYPVPEYLYNDALQDDLSYLLNLDILYHYGLNNILGSLRGQSSKAERRGITLTGTFSAENTLASYSRPAITNTVQSFDDPSLRAAVEKNLANITGLIETHPNTEFVFFMPPFSMLYWDREIRQGSFDSTMDATQYAMERLLSYSNVKFYFYQAEESIITDLDNYKDYSHYGHWINDTVTRFIAEDYGRVYFENIAATIQHAKELIRNYPFDTLFS